METTIDTGPAARNERLVYWVAEVGALLGISRAFAYELVARGELPVIRLGRRRLVPKAAFIAFVGLEPAHEALTSGASNPIPLSLDTAGPLRADPRPLYIVPVRR